MSIILAPHPDDELIGCFSLLVAKEIKQVIYFFDWDKPSLRGLRKDEAIYCSSVYGFEPIFVQGLDNYQALFASLTENLVYIPSLNDSHPQHKEIHRIFRFLPNKKFYSVDLDTNVVGKNLLDFKGSSFKEKEQALNSIYPSQKELWKNNYSYILFENISKGFTLKHKLELTFNGKLYAVTTDIQEDLYKLEHILNTVNIRQEQVPLRLLDYLVSKGASFVEIEHDNKVWLL